MATGYPVRPAGRQSFAPEVAPPVQSQSTRRGASNGAQVVGGRAQGSGVTVGPQTAPGSIGGELGEYFGKLMRPYIERKSKELFFKGFSEAQHGTAIEELTSSGSAVTRIFGPTGFEEGAQFYTAQTALDQFSTDMLTDLPELRKLPPEEAAKLLAAKSDSLMTKDSGTNILIQGGLMERMGPVMTTVAKARVEWQQNNAVNAMNIAHDTAAAALQDIKFHNARSDDPSAWDNVAGNLATEQFLRGRAKPEGMTDDSYIKYLGGSAMSDIVAGRFYAVEAMKSAGAWNILDEETRTKLDVAYERHSTKALGKAAAMLAPQLLALRTEIKLSAEPGEDGKPRGFPGGAMEAMKRLSGINERAKLLTGSNMDLFDYKDFVGAGGDVVDVIVAATRRAEARAEQIADMQTRRGWELEDKAADEQAGAAQVTTLWGIGDVNAADAAGIPNSKFEPIALAEVRNGDYSGILRAWKNPGGSWVSSTVSTMLQSAVKSAIGDEYTQEIGNSHKQWLALYQASPSAASAYYKDMHAPMLRFDALLRNKQSPQAAFAQAFGDPSKYHAASIPDGRKKEASEAITAVIGGTESSWFNPFGGAYLSPSSLKATTALMTNRFAVLASGDSNLSDEAVAKQALAAMKADGSYERYGAYAWGNKAGTKTLASETGLQGKEMDTVFSYVVSRALKRVGYTENPETGDTIITRMKMPNGHPAFHVEAINSDGSGSKQAIITVGDLKAYSQHQRDLKFLRDPSNRSASAQVFAATQARYKAYQAAYPN